MQKALLLKALITAALTLLLLIPIEMIHETVYERQANQAQVMDQIAASYAGSQQLVGPILALPYVEEYTHTEWERAARGSQEGVKIRREYPRRREGVLYLMPTELTLTGQAGVDFKRRGLFKALVFDLNSHIQGRFEIPAELPLKQSADDSVITWGRPFLSLGLDDTRGLGSTPQLTWQGRPVELVRGSGVDVIPNGIHALVDGLQPKTAQSIEFALDLDLRGTHRLSFVPLAENTRVSLSSPWPHPSFDGRFLPDPQTQSVSDEGFSAEWEVTALATNASRAFREAAAKGDIPQIGFLESFGVRFIEPVNIYSMADRALKYGFLFVGLSFGAFFLFELLKGLRIHPAQYLLVGLALAIFFLLLLSLSEHVTFGVAYLVAAVASVALQGFYLSYVLRGVRRGLGFAALLGALFAALYGLLVSEDNALLMGSLLLFGLLALAMGITRNFDWYSVKGLARPAKEAVEKA